MIKRNQAVSVWLAVLCVCLLAVACSQAVRTAPQTAADLKAGSKVPAASSLFVPASRQVPDLKFVNHSPYVWGTPLRYATPAFEALEERLQDIERTVQSRALPIHHIFVFTYGSGFLKYTRVGNDMDAMVGVHLGRLHLDAKDPRATAEQLISRMEEYLNVMIASMQRNQDAKITVMSFRLLSDGKFKNREKLIEKMTNSLRDVAENREHRVIVDSLYGLRVPTVLSAHESYVYETTRVQLFSNQIRSVNWMLAGIREFQVMFHFFCDMDVVSSNGATRTENDFAIHPTFVPSGAVLKYRDNLMGVTPLGEASARWISGKARADLDLLVDERIDLTRRMIADTRRNLEINDRVKAIKRLHQARDGLEPALDPAFVKEIDAFLNTALSDPDMLLCGEAKELSETSEKSFEIPSVLAVYRQSYDLQQSLIRVSKDLGFLADHRPEFKEQSDAAYENQEHLREMLEKFPTSEQREEAGKTLRGMADVGEKCLDLVSPPSAKIEDFAKRIEDRLAEADLKSFPVYGMPDDTMGILEADIATLGAVTDLQKELEAAGAFSGFQYRMIRQTEKPKDPKGRPVDPSITFLLRPKPTAAQQQSYQKMRQALATDTARFHFLPAQNDDFEMLRDAFFQKFGDQGQTAWNSSRTGYDGLLALLNLDAPTAKQLLDTHLKITAASKSAARILPVYHGSAEIQLAMEQALATTAERILEGTAVAQLSSNKEGLTVESAKEAQKELFDLENALTEVVENHATTDPATTTRENQTGYLLKCANGSVLHMSVRPRRDTAQARIQFELVQVEHQPTRDHVELRIDVSGIYGAGIDVAYTSSLIDWGVHGALPDDPFIPDHHFFDHIPADMVGTRSPGSTEKVAAAFDDYVENSFVPEIIGDLPKQ